LKGRFAERLAVDNRRWPYDIMDGDAFSAGPLFEQMYPYERGLQGDEDSLSSEAPLTKFQLGESLQNPAPGTDLVGLRARQFRSSQLQADDDIAKVLRFAEQEFERFYRLVGVQILRFAREEYTPTHIRVLTALMAMESPPSELGEGFLGADALVAAARGQLDEDDGSLMEFRSFSQASGFKINYRELPASLVERHIQNFGEWTNPTPGFLTAFLDDLVDYVDVYLKEDVVFN
jgi:hypothetical protein